MVRDAFARISNVINFKGSIDHKGDNEVIEENKEEIKNIHENEKDLTKAINLEFYDYIGPSNIHFTNRAFWVEQ